VSRIPNRPNWSQRMVIAKDSWCGMGDDVCEFVEIGRQIEWMIDDRWLPSLSWTL
jgi:hypothetical protein